MAKLEERIHIASLDVDCPAIVPRGVRCIPTEDRGSEAEGNVLSEGRHFATIAIVAASYCSSRSLTDHRRRQDAVKNSSGSVTGHRGACVKPGITGACIHRLVPELNTTTK